jgi:putative Ca2+/H+ antiporter (TMEM165/GDT1 family)
MAAFIASFVFVVLAEMGDKTQLLAMAFATRYKAYKVLIAVFIATVLNHALAVAAGRFLTTIVPLDIISLIAALSFILFGLWTIRGDALDGEDAKKSRFGPIATVAIAFFLAEMGDKTQLATISLAVEYKNTLGVLAGTTTGMLVADGIGIVVGIVLCKKIPERTIKWISAVVFVLFGLRGIFQTLSGRIALLPMAGVLLLLVTITLYAAYLITRKPTAPATISCQRRDDLE